MHRCRLKESLLPVNLWLRVPRFFFFSDKLQGTHAAPIYVRVFSIRSFWKLTRARRGECRREGVFSLGNWVMDVLAGLLLALMDEIEWGKRRIYKILRWTKKYLRLCSISSLKRWNIASVTYSLDMLLSCLMNSIKFWGYVHFIPL